MPLVNGWAPAIEHYQKVTSSPSAQDGLLSVKRYGLPKKESALHLQLPPEMGSTRGQELI